MGTRPERYVLVLPLLFKPPPPRLIPELETCERRLRDYHPSYLHSFKFPTPANFAHIKNSRVLPLSVRRCEYRSVEIY